MCGCCCAVGTGLGLTAAAYGVSEFLFVYGDKPGSGGRTSDLTVRSMIEESRGSAQDGVFAGSPPWRVGVAAALRPLPEWKRDADFVFTQVSYSVEEQLRWRDANPVDVPVYAGVMVLASAGMARRLAASIPDIEVPGSLVEQVAADPVAGVGAACEQIARRVIAALSMACIWCRFSATARSRHAWKPPSAGPDTGSHCPGSPGGHLPGKGSAPAWRASGGPDWRRWVRCVRPAPSQGWARVGGPPCCSGVAVCLGGVSVRGWRRPRQSVVAAWPGVPLQVRN